MGYVKYETKGQVGIITIDRPKALNALNSQVLDDLKEVLDGVDQEEIRCLIVTGSGEKSFVAGADIAAMSTMTQAEAEAFGKKGNDIFRALEVFPIPTIAAVNGFALGGGCELAMACDIRIASVKAKFGQPEVGLGIIPGFSGTCRLPKLIGQGYAKEMIYTGKAIRADEALRIGLVNAVYEPEVLMEKVIETAQKIVANAPLAIKYAKECINESYDMVAADAIELENRNFGKCFATEDQKEGMTAFLNKGKANFKGR